jgi:hypothetical protein
MAQQRYSQTTVIEALRKSHGLKAVAARALGCHRNTVDEYCRRYQSVADVIREERESMTDIAESALFRKINVGEAWAVCFYLKTQAKDRGYVERTEHTGMDGERLGFTINIAGSKVDDGDAE